jgi:Raf kinase inhibitor-like YbhB/YbcL family protein
MTLVRYMNGSSREENPMRVSSPAFAADQSIPSKYTCDGEDLIPPLEFTNVPPNAKALALIVDDPDAPMGTWDHWLIWNIPASTTRVVEGKAPEGVTGRNSWNKNAWGGPCPPDREHRYFFRMYALDTMLNLPPSARKSDLQKAMEGHTVAEAELMGRYDRTSRRG